MSFLSDVWIWLGIIACVVQSALFSGLNLAIFSFSQLHLQVVADSGDTDAACLLSLRKNSNQVLATIIWGNVSTNVLLTLLSNSVLTGLVAFFFSAVVITLLGEICPQAYFSQRDADDGAFPTVPEFLPRRFVSPGQADRNAARCMAR
jgi:metal transporter CNNM